MKPVNTISLTDAYENEIPKALIREIANGFLAFDDFVVAKDVFSDREIRGIIETVILSFLQ